MRFEERDEGDYRIYAGVRESAGNGFVAAMAISRVRGIGGAVLAVSGYQELAERIVWASAEDALAFALAKGIAAVRLIERRSALVVSTASGHCAARAGVPIDAAHATAAFPSLPGPDRRNDAMTTEPG